MHCMVAVVPLFIAEENLNPRIICDAVSLWGVPVQLEAVLGSCSRSLFLREAVGPACVSPLYIVLDSVSQNPSSLVRQSQRNFTVAHNVLKERQNVLKKAGHTAELHSKISQQTPLPKKRNCSRSQWL